MPLHPAHVALVLVMLACPAVARPVIHHDLDVTLDPAARRLQVVDRIRVEGGPPPELVLAPAFTVTRREADGTGLRIEYEGTLAPLSADSQTPQAGADGAFLPDGSGWFPLADADVGSYALAVSVPAPFVAAATGRLVEETRSGDRYHARYRDDRPVEPPSLFAGRWEVKETMHGPLRLRTYLPADLVGLADDLLADTARHLDRYQKQVGPYPYDGFAIVAGTQPVGFGFPGLTYVSRQVLPLPFFRGQSLAHEILHNWWGNGVRVDYARGNWAEGLTTYLADHDLAADRDPETAKEMRLAWLRDYAALPADRDRPLSAFRSREHDADQVVGYGKAAFVFHMLRDRLGADGFTEGLRLFWRENRFKTAGWTDLRQAFEAAGAQDLSTVFAQWLERPGAPRPTLVSAEPVVLPGGHHGLTVTLRQEAPIFDLLVPVWVETSEGPERHRLRLEHAQDTATFDLAGPARAVTVDPDHDLFRRLAANEAPPILRDVTLNPAAVAVLAGEPEAGEALAARLIGGTVRSMTAEAARLAKAPVVLVGIGEAVEKARATLGLGAMPAALQGPATARVWVERDDRGRAVLTIAATDTAALEALHRPLPHYARQSWLAFDGRQALRKGVWPADLSALTRRFKIIVPIDDPAAPQGTEGRRSR